MEKPFETEVITRLTKIETKLDDYKQVRDDSIRALQIATNNDCEIKELKDNATWMWRTLILSVLGIITSFILTFLKLR